jgi:hypothetical protein
MLEDEEVDRYVDQLKSRPNIKDVFAALEAAFGLVDGWWQYVNDRWHGGPVLVVLGIPTTNTEDVNATAIETLSPFGIKPVDVSYDLEFEQLSVFLPLDSINAPPPKTKEEAEEADLFSGREEEGS